MMMNTPESNHENRLPAFVEQISKICEARQGAEVILKNKILTQINNKNQPEHLDTLLDMLADNLKKLENPDLKVSKIEDEIRAIMEILRSTYAIRSNEAAPMLLGDHNRRFDWYQAKARM